MVEREVDDVAFMRMAFEEAKKGAQEGGIPIGAVLVLLEDPPKVLGRGHNQRVQKRSATLHAEMDCVENAGRLVGSVYKNTCLYTTLSPCDMCTGCILLYGIPRVVIGENHSFRGKGEELLRSRGVEVVVLDDAEIRGYFCEWIRRNEGLWNEDIGV
ncbi:unnamed protein product [Vitrella brassicaformis CCMP3155]|uniref:Cytosine deaminase n=2 Tax=Vitrella brassicaformis TaxID=1169539 RepID=A0A0G4EC62_VITBC|nr:unnamed protein product [Vitrella brassicaformis CCMP3155]|eukprot:CEL93078.1 unnamed protein product [Vitrella brassicaformis CCMP3155]